ncbi:UNVERIFIED_CONTAM: hypothetical protein GTU68_006309 [Idotea baltica]|nr:hypothetical protein [Idotea baltica]
MIAAFSKQGNLELDTAYVYNKGKTEELLGVLNARNVLTNLQIAGKANPWVEDGLSPASVEHQLTTSLNRLKVDSIDLFYLHAPDLNTPIIDTLKKVADLHSVGKFTRFGLSNYAAWQVAEISEICKREGWVQPTVYQGMYNALTRDVERELFQCIENYNMAFYVYNPLAGGLLSGKHQSFDAMPTDGRFATFNGYQDRYWKPSYFNVINQVSDTCKAHDVAPAEAALQWLVHHSALSASAADHGVILGASSIDHLEQNLAAMQNAALPDAVVAAYDEAWETVRPACIKYFRP